MSLLKCINDAIDINAMVIAANDKVGAYACVETSLICAQMYLVNKGTNKLSRRYPKTAKAIFAACCVTTTVSLIATAITTRRALIQQTRIV